MRWEKLFGDLEAQFDALEAQDLQAELPDRVRGEVAGIALAHRLYGAVGAEISADLLGGVRVSGALVDVGPDWLLVQEALGGQALVPTASVATLAGVGRRAVPPPARSRVGARLRLTAALRAIARDRSVVRVHLVTGVVLHGVLERVGADFVDATELPMGESRRAAPGSGRVVPLAAVAAVRTAPG
ncbi:MAG: hypothetical protein M3P48_06020 [Actinomycetota bacterium]|nr:hypothetical protein [Actinomycetota bacterium]